MTTVRIRKVGGSMMVALPVGIAKDLGLAVGDELTIGLRRSEIVARPVARKKYTLAELLAQCDPAAPMSEEDRLWLSSPPVGREII
jgi:antitoxin ChpS